MAKKIVDIFEEIHAEEDLKKKTIRYLYDEIEKRSIKREIAFQKRRPGFSIACAFLMLFFLCGGFFYKIYFTPAAYIDIDVNPSIGLTVNAFGIVIRHDAYNDDGGRVLGEIKTDGIQYGKAFERLIDRIETDGYFEGDPLLFVTVQTKKNAVENDMLNSLQEIIDTKEASKIVADIYAITQEVKYSANEHHVSPAKYLAIQELMQVDATINFEECKKNSIHELQQLTEQKCARHEDESNADVQGEQDEIGNVGQEEIDNAGQEEINNAGQEEINNAGQDEINNAGQEEIDNAEQGEINNAGQGGTHDAEQEHEEINEKQEHEEIHGMGQTQEESLPEQEYENESGIGSGHEKHNAGGNHH